MVAGLLREDSCSAILRALLSRKCIEIGMGAAELDAEAKTTIDELFELKGAKREAKAYAFLWAAFRRTEIGANPVRDALDCLIPFVAPYTNRIPGQQVTAEGIQTYLKEDFGFDIPQY